MRKTNMPFKKNSIFRHWLYLFRLYSAKLKNLSNFVSNLSLLFGALGTLTLLIYQFGFISEDSSQELFYAARPHLLRLFIGGMFLRYITHLKEIYKEKLFVLDIMLFITVVVQSFLLRRVGNMPEGVVLPQIWNFILHQYITYALLLTLSFIHLSRLMFTWFNKKIKPSLIFIFSFLVLIFIGAGLLMLPSLTHDGIAYIDALFMSTTSVCVTGLTSVNVAEVFTLKGQVVILMLIQLGGIGVITFTSFFALSFISNTSVSSQLMLKDLLNEKKVGNLFKVLLTTIMVTFLIEGAGAYLIYKSIAGSMESFGMDVFISIFHSVSAYCNAGISPLPDNIGSLGFIHNHLFHFWISCIIVLGGLGFPIVLNVLRFGRYAFVNMIFALLGRKGKRRNEPRMIYLHTRLALNTTFILIVGGTILFFLFERNGTLSDLSIGAKWVESFFYAVTPRTAGFSTYPTQWMSQPALLLTIVLMMIGASPMSTGGGIKTTTAAVAAITALKIIRSDKDVEIWGRRIDSKTIRKAFATITIFMAWVFVTTLVICILEPKQDAFALFFEVVSATATVGSSMGITADLCMASKILLVCSMFVGRIGLLTFFLGITVAQAEKHYSYPSENILLA